MAHATVGAAHYILNVLYFSRLLSITGVNTHNPVLSVMAIFRQPSLYFLAMRVSVCFLATLLLSSTTGTSADNSCASMKESGNEVTLTVTSWDPVLAIGRTLVDRYGVSLSIEAPRWAFPGDTEDVAAADPAFSKQHGNIHYALMKRHHLQVQFSLGDTGRLGDIPSLVRQIADAANKEMPYAYRVDIDGQDYALVPTRSRNSRGELEDVEPLLDRHVTIPAGTRTIAEHARLMADQLSQQTGLHVSCCQALVLGVPWGRMSVTFEAHNKPAREVLRSLIRIEDYANSQAPNSHPVFDHWTVSCDGTGVPWCLIEVEGKFSSRCPNSGVTQSPSLYHPALPDSLSKWR